MNFINRFAVKKFTTIIVEIHSESFIYRSIFIKSLYRMVTELSELLSGTRIWKFDGMTLRLGQTSELDTIVIARRIRQRQVIGPVACGATVQSVALQRLKRAR